jgi:hypothetical protein
MHRPSRRGSGDAREAWARARGRGGERARAGRLAHVRVGRGSERIPSGRVEHATTDTVVDLTTNGDSTGDLLTFHNELFDAGNENVVGTDQGECVRIEVGVSWECRWINFLEGGSSTVEGPFSMRDPRRWPSPEARECIEERAGACVSCLVTRPGRSSTSSSGS